MFKLPFLAGEWGWGDEAHAVCHLQDNKLITVDLYPLPAPPLPPSASRGSAICFFYHQVSAELLKPERWALPNLTLVAIEHWR